MRSITPAEVLFDHAHRRILALLLLHPESSLPAREIGRMTGIPPASLQRELKRLALAGLVQRERIGSRIRYRADRDCPVFAEIAALLHKTVGLDDLLREALAPLGAAVELAFVCGPAASDAAPGWGTMDVFVVGSVDPPGVSRAFAAIRARLGHPVRPLVVSRRELRASFEAGDLVISRIMQEPKRFLVGNADRLRRLLDRRAPAAG